MGKLLKSLVILYLLHGFLTKANNHDRDDAKEICLVNQEIKFGVFNGFNFGLPIARRKPPGDENPGCMFPLGSWEIHSENAGVSAMHIQLMPNNKAVWYDSTSNGLSEIENDPPFCTPRVGDRKTDPQQDCTAHAVEYDIYTARLRPLKVPLPFLILLFLPFQSFEG